MFEYVHACMHEYNGPKTSAAVGKQAFNQAKTTPTAKPKISAVFILVDAGLGCEFRFQKQQTKKMMQKEVKKNLANHLTSRPTKQTKTMDGCKEHGHE